MTTYENLLVNFPMKFTDDSVSDLHLECSKNLKDEAYKHNISNIKSLLGFLSDSVSHVKSKELIKNFYYLYARLTHEEQLEKLGVEIHSIPIFEFTESATEEAIKLIHLNFSLLKDYESRLYGLAGAQDDTVDLLMNLINYFMYLSYGYGVASCIDFSNRIVIANNMLRCTSQIADGFFGNTTKWLETFQQLNKECEDRAFSLSERKKALRKPDTYGFIDENKWIAETKKFAKKLVSEVASDESNPIILYVYEKCVTHKTGFIKNALKKFESEANTNRSIPSEKSNHQKGADYEEECSLLLKNNGWDILETPSSGDMGVDLLGLKYGIKVAFQCKNWSTKINPSAIQEVFTGKELYDAKIAVIVTETGLTTQANEMSGKLDVICISKEEITSLEGIIIKHLTK